VAKLCCLLSSKCTKTCLAAGRHPDPQGSLQCTEPKAGLSGGAAAPGGEDGMVGKYREDREKEGIRQVRDREGKGKGDGGKVTLHVPHLSLSSGYAPVILRTNLSTLCVVSMTSYTCHG